MKLVHRKLSHADLNCLVLSEKFLIREGRSFESLMPKQ